MQRVIEIPQYHSIGLLREGVVCAQTLGMDEWVGLWKRWEANIVIIEKCLLMRRANNEINSIPILIANETAHEMSLISNSKIMGCDETCFLN